MKEIFLNVKGMMCEGCENRVKTVIKNIEGVKEVSANHNNGMVYIKANDDISQESIKEAIEDIGYEVEKDN